MEIKSYKHPVWSKEEFLTFLLIYGASADTVISAPEKNEILKRISSVKYHEIKKYFESLTDKQVLDVITEYRGLYFPTREQKQEILSEMKKLIYSDGELAPIEQGVYLLLERIL